MEIPVRMIQQERQFQEEEKKVVLCQQQRPITIVTEEQQQQQQQTRPVTIFNKNDNIFTKSNKWVHLVQLEDSLLPHCMGGLENFEVKVHRQPRVVVLRIRNTPFERIVEVPHFVNIHDLKVKWSAEKKVIIVKAPRYNNNNNNIIEEFPREQVLLEEPRRELELMRRWDSSNAQVDIPVRMLKNEEELVEKRLIKEQLLNEEEERRRRELFRECDIPSRTLVTEFQEERPRKQVIEQEWSTGVATTTSTTTPRVWFHILEDERLERFSREQLRCKVNPTLRVIVLKVRDSTFKRIIRVPRHVELQQVKVKFLQQQPEVQQLTEMKLCEKRTFIRLEAPTLINKLERREKQYFDQETETFEYENGMYKLLKYLHRQCPLLTPRVVRCQKTGRIMALLDLECPEHVVLSHQIHIIKKCHEKVLIIKKKNEDLEHLFTLEQQHRRPFYFELNVPTHFKLDEFKTELLNERTVRIVLPFEEKKKKFITYSQF